MKKARIDCSAKDSFERYVYVSGESFSYDIISIAKKLDKLTFDERFLDKKFTMCGRITPFKEIDWITPQQECPYPELLEAQIPTTASFDDFLISLKEGLRKSILNLWNPADKHLMLHSAGFDSRIISGMLAELRDEGMNLGEIHFRCHQPECEGFFEIMKREKWKEDQYSCYCGSVRDYYNIGVSDISVNGFVNYNQQMNFWWDIVPRAEEKDWNLIIGLGGEMFKYIGGFKKPNFVYCDNFGLNMLIDMTPGYGEWEGQWATRFKNLIMPFAGYEYLEVASKVHTEWCTRNKETDDVRFSLSKLFDYNITEIPWGSHDYKWDISRSRKAEMMNLYHTGEFFKKYKKRINPFSDLYGWDAKMWGFGVTVYDEIYS